MERTKALFASLYLAALSFAAFPALALAQGATGGSAPSTGGGAAPAGGSSIPAGDAGGQGGAGWLWIVAALVVLAIIWWAMSSRRRHGTVTR